MKCRRAKALIFDFIDGILSDSDRGLLEQHLGQCPSCEETAAELKKSLDLLHRAPEMKLDENFNWKVRLAIQKERDALTRQASSSGVWLRAWNARFVATAVAACAVVVVAGFYALTSFNETPDGFGNPGIAENTPPANPATPNRPQLYSSPVSGVQGKFVSTDPARQPTSSGTGLFVEDSGDLDTESLKDEFARSQRMRALEEQIMMLQSELKSCQTDKNE